MQEYDYKWQGDHWCMNLIGEMANSEMICLSGQASGGQENANIK
jgi:hypothetical protein